MSLKNEIYNIMPISLRIRHMIAHNSGLYSIKRYHRQSSSQKTIYIIGEACNGNLGDQAITVCQAEFLNKNFGECYRIERVLISDFWVKLPYLIEKTMMTDIFAIQGGGNLGDNYIEAEIMRQVLIYCFHKNKIIIFPQTVHFSNTKRGRKTKRDSQKIYKKNKKLTICSRETHSEELLKNIFTKNNIVLIPDIVLFYPFFISDADTQGDHLLLCLRNDKESILNQWQYENIIEILEKKSYNVKITDTYLSDMTLVDDDTRILHIQNKLTEFSKAKIIITDRLHGMVFAAISQTPCIVLSNYNHKIRGVYDWIKDLEYIYFANSIEQLEELINNIKIPYNCKYSNKHLDMYQAALVDLFRN